MKEARLGCCTTVDRKSQIYKYNDQNSIASSRRLQTEGADENPQLG